MVFELLRKLHLQIFASQFMTLQIIPLILFHFSNYSNSPFVSRKFGKEVKKLQKFEYLENEKSFLDEIKNTFHSF